MKDNFFQYINGRIVEGKGRIEEVICPGNDEVVGRFSLATAEQAEEALKAAQDSFPIWSGMPLEEREVWIKKLRRVIMEHEEELIRLVMLETGKVRAHADFEPGQIWRYLKYFVEEAKCSHADGIRDVTGGKGEFFAVREPLGVVVCALAWNFPLHNMATKLGPILASGCTAVIKPATFTPMSALYLGELLEKIDFPKGVINIVSGKAGEIGDTLCRSTIPAMVTMIGSTRGGLRMIESSVTSIKRFSMELGGDAPVIVTPSADIRKAAEHTMTGKICDAGQTCVSPQRAIIHRSIYEAFVRECVELAENAVCGTLEEDADMDPMITHEAADRMQALVDDAVEKGAVLLCGGKKPDKEKGSYYLPTILEKTTGNMRVRKEEIFGPILLVMPYDTVEEAIRIANDTEYGLSSYIWGTDFNEIIKISRGLQFGVVNVNAPGTNASLPHGGCKNSGIGKDGSRYSLEEYYYIKGVRIAVDTDSSM